MKKSNLFFGIFYVLFFIEFSFSQSLGINTTGAPADASSILDLTASDRGILIPRMSQSQRTLINAPATGLLVYQSDGINGFYFYDGTAWIKLVGNGSNENNWLVENSASAPAVNSNNQYVAGNVGVGDYSSSAVGAKIEVKSGSLGVTLNDGSGVSLTNPTAASVSAQQLSPALKWLGNGWSATNANSQTVEFTADVQPVQGTVAPSGVWRLSSSINDGATEAFDPISLICFSDGEQNGLIVHPNPAEDFFKVSVYSPDFASTAEVVITDMAGKVISTRKVNLEAGTNEFIFDCYDLNPGSYLVRVISSKMNLNPVKLLVN